MLGVLLDRRAREHDGVAAILQLCDEVVRTDEGHDLVHHLLELLLPFVPHVVADLPVDDFAGDGGDVQVPAHADVPVQMAQREHDVVLAERAIPRQRLLVAGRPSPECSKGSPPSDARPPRSARGRRSSS